MTTEKQLPQNLIKLRAKLLRKISPLSPSSEKTEFTENYYSIRSKAGRELPEYYFVYFLLVELLGFKNLGRMDKVAWEIPVDFRGKGFFIGHRKFGLGLFIGKEDDEKEAKEIVGLLWEAVLSADLFYSWKVDQQIKTSSINVKNEYHSLLDRYVFFKDLCLGEKGVGREASWFAISAIEAFFSWSEHAFIIMAILLSKIENGEDFVRISREEWKKKFQVCLGLQESEADYHFNFLLRIKDDVRNYMAHGSFGRRGETFHIHSTVGAVPVSISRSRKQKVKMIDVLREEPREILNKLDEFIDFFHKGSRERALKYIENTDYPINLEWVIDGKFEQAMASDEDMADFIKEVEEILFRNWNMEW